MRVALVAVVKQESNLPEWVVWHRSWGFDEIYLVANDWQIPKGLDATYLEAPGTGIQLKVYNEWLELFGDKFDYVAFFDADEYLYLPELKSVKDLLSGYSIAINWVFFGSNEEPDQTGVINRFQFRAAYTDRHVKPIIRTDPTIKMLNPHFCNRPTLSPEGLTIHQAFNHKGSMNKAFLAHYFTQDEQYFAKKIARGRVDIGYKNNRTMDEWHEYNVFANDVYDPRLAERFNQLKNV
jgi:hypothetical protein